MQNTYRRLPADAREGHRELALVALRQPGQPMLDTGSIQPTWHAVPLSLRDDVLFDLISSGNAVDFRIIYAVGEVQRARAVRDERRNRARCVEQFFMALHPRVGRDSCVRLCEPELLCMIARMAGLMVD